MARRKRSSVSTRRSGNTEIVVVEPPQQRAVTAPKKRSRSRRRSNGGLTNRTSKKNEMIGVAIGGVAYGFIEKSWPGLPTVPIVGKAGTIALAAYFFGGNNAIVNDVGIAAAAIAGYQLGKEGRISGVFDDDYAVEA